MVMVAAATFRRLCFAFAEIIIAPLEGGLGVERQVIRGPVREHVPLAHSFFDVGNQRRSVLADTAIGRRRGWQGWRVVDLLHHGAGEQVKSGSSPMEQRPCGNRHRPAGGRAGQRVRDTMRRQRTAPVPSIQ